MLKSMRVALDTRHPNRHAKRRPYSLPHSKKKHLTLTELSEASDFVRMRRNASNVSKKRTACL